MVRKDRKIRKEKTEDDPIKVLSDAIFKTL